MKKYIFALAVLLSTTPAFALFDWDSYKYVQMNSTATVSVNPAKLHSVTISSGVVTGNMSIYILDSTTTASNVVISTIAVFGASNASPAGTYIFDVQTQNGIQVNCPVNGPQITISYR